MSFHGPLQNRDLLQGADLGSHAHRLQWALLRPPSPAVLTGPAETQRENGGSHDIGESSALGVAAAPHSVSEPLFMREEERAEPLPRVCVLTLMVWEGLVATLQTVTPQFGSEDVSSFL